MDDTRDERLIEAVKSFHCLWNVQSRLYRDQRAKDNAWTKVSEVMEGMRIDDCKRKWKSLRDRFVSEQRKKKRKSGDEGPPFKSTWPLYDMMLFLEDTVRHRPTVSNYQATEVVAEETVVSEETIVYEDTTGTTSQEDIVQVSVDESASQELSEDESTSTHAMSLSSSPRVGEPCPPVQKKRHITSKKSVDEALIQLSKSMVDRQKQRVRREAEKQSQVRNPETNYGLEIAETLNRFAPRQRSLAKMKIQQLLFEIEYPDS